MTTKELLLEEIGKNWYYLIEEDLKDVSILSYFREMFKNLNKYNEENNYPKRDEIFRIFKLLSPKDIKVIILGQSPYPNKGYANGIAFAISEEQMSVPYSLKTIRQEIENSLYDGLYIDFDYELKHLLKQGVFMLNTSLTTKKNVSEAIHLPFWERFISLILNRVSKTNPNIVYILMGSNAKSFREKIHYHNFIIETVHPASERYNPQTFLGCGCFKKCNEYLNCTNNKEIIW